jgi:tetratricopeptide (TPR) repeat protein
MPAPFPRCHRGAQARCGFYRLHSRVFRAAFVGLVILLAGAGPRATGADKEAEYVAEMEKGEAALRKQQYEDALKSFKRASSLGDKKSAAAHYGMALAYYGLGAFKSSADSCDKALEHAGEDKDLQARVHNQRGLARFALAEKPDDKRVKEAEADFRSALALNDSLHIARYNLGGRFADRVGIPKGSRS